MAIYYALSSLILLGLGWHIFWKWQHEKPFEKHQIDDEECLRVKCYRPGRYRFYAVIFFVVVLPLLCYSYISKPTPKPRDTEAILRLTMFLLIIGLLSIKYLLAIISGQVLQIGKKGIIFPVAGLYAKTKFMKQNYNKLESSEFAFCTKRIVIAPAKSILSWEWADNKNVLTLTLSGKIPEKGTQKEADLVFPILKSSERQEIIGILNSMNCEGC